MSDLHPIRTEADYDWALAEVERLMDLEPHPGSPSGDRLEILLLLISNYEDQRYPIPQADPVTVLQFAIQDMGHSQNELADILGSRSRASEILSRKRSLTLPQIRAISEAWRLPIAALTATYELVAEHA
ncbi:MULTISPECIES: transcriptional regulator [unclassified Methylobacterium]|uniref:helix-turn-helix domain-containing protein n=1 Tax=unclassified Methylobacterium TaxID=2615210 RepID=UPI0022699CB9|nr:MULTISPECIES: transcriptional regulator [unclassified Methylobacterium]